MIALLFGWWVLVSVPCVAGEGTSLPLWVKGNEVGFVVVSETLQGRTVMTPDALRAVEPLLTTEAFIEVNKAVPRTGWLLGQRYAGVLLAFDAARVVVDVVIPADMERPAKLDLREDGQPPNGRMVKPDAVSAYMNMYAAQSYMDGYGAVWDGRQPLRVDFDGAVNLDGWVLEGQPGYVEKDEHPWMVQNVRVVKDDEQNMIRYQTGELSYPTASFQNYRPLLGFGFARNFLLQPYFVSQPAGRSSFVLGSASTVDIYVNGVRQKSLQLQPGVYELNDFPVVSGANNVKMVITDAAGRVEEKVFPVVSDGNLLSRGLAEFSANGGIPVESLNRVRTFDGDHPVFSGLMRYGMMDGWTTGVNVQGGEMRQMGGLEQTLGTEWGMFKAENALSYIGDSGRYSGWGNAVRLAYWNVAANVEDSEPHDSWQMAVQYRTANFNLVTSTTPANAYGLELQSSYGHAFSPALSMSVGSNYRFGRLTQDDDYRTSADLYYQLMPQLTLNLNTSYSRQEQYGMFVNLAWMGSEGRQSINTSYDSSSRVSRADWHYRPEGNGNGWDTSVQLEKTPGADTAGGRLNYQGQRGTMRLEHDQRMELGVNENYGNMGTNSQLSMATGLVYSGGEVALSRPVLGSFAIVTPASKTSGTDVALNVTENEEGVTSEAESSWFGPAVLSELTPYVYRAVSADVSHKKDIDRDSFVLHPTYKSGAHVKAGKKSHVVVKGYLKDADEKPLGLMGGQIAQTTDLNGIEPAAGPDDAPRKPVVVFTNRDGRFQLEDLEPGKYKLIINGNAKTAIDFDVPENVEEVNLGSQQVDMKPGRATASVAVSDSEIADDGNIEPSEGPVSGTSLISGSAAGVR